MIFDDSLADFTTLKGVRIITYFQKHSILTNKPNFRNVKINVSSFVTSKYVQVGQLVIQTNKANSKPIQTQFKPKQTQLKPKQTQFKPNLPNGQKCWSLPSMLAHLLFCRGRG